MKDDDPYSPRGDIAAEFSFIAKEYWDWIVSHKTITVIMFVASYAAIELFYVYTRK